MLAPLNEKDYYWQGPSGFGDGCTIECGDVRKNSRVVATAESPEMASLIVAALNAYEAEALSE